MRIPASRIAWLFTIVATAGIPTGSNGNSRDPEISRSPDIASGNP